MTLVQEVVQTVDHLSLTMGDLLTALIVLIAWRQTDNKSGKWMGRLEERVDQIDRRLERIERKGIR